MMHVRRNFYRCYLKSAIDRAVAAAALFLCAPMLIAIAVTVRVKLGSPILFTQIRPGKKGRAFCLYKFRTMTDRRSEAGQLLGDAERLTSFGKWLRSTSLDELPELWNVLRGDMSLVGPRPLLDSYLPRYTSTQARRHDVKPGLTGWAQVHGRNAISWEERFQYDTYYVEHLSAWLDIRILVTTVWIVVARIGISADSHATMPMFTGTAASEEENARAA